MTATFRPSPQQSQILDWVTTGRGNAIIEAVAGAGKTTTLVQSLARMTGSVALVAYNKAIAEEIKAKIADPANGVRNPGVRAGTFHSFGYSAWLRACGDRKPRLEERKLDYLMNPDAPGAPRDLPAVAVPEPFRPFVKAAVSLAKQRAYGVLVSVEEDRPWLKMVDHFELESLLEDVGDLAAGPVLMDAIRYAKAVLAASVATDKDVIDFDDMIYAPLVHNVRIWQNDWVLVDEAQDTNPARRALAKRMLRPGGRLIAVGDPCQAIYGFTGADNDALETIRKEFACATLPLTVTYRCPKAVVRLARTYVSHIESHPASPEGEVRSMNEAEFAALDAADLRAEDAILCRNTKPLVETAFALIRRGIACHVEGRDIGAGLNALVKRYKAKTVEALFEKLDAWLEKETAKLMAKGQETKAELLADRVETLRVIGAKLPVTAKPSDLSKVIFDLFGDTPAGKRPENLTLATVHKSKGREWERVYLLGRNVYMPSPYARQDWQQEQERNLIYVAVTRAKKTLVDVLVQKDAKSPKRAPVDETVSPTTTAR